MSRPIPPSYKTKNWPAYNEALKQRGSLTIWFDPDMVWVPPPTGKRGRQAQYSDAAIQTCLTMKVLFGMALRQTTGFVESLLRLVGLDWAVPDFSTLSRRQKTLAVCIPYRGSQGPLNLLIDSTCIKAEGEGEWHARKHGGAKRRLWRKIHIGVDEQTLETVPSRLPGATSVTRRCCPSFSARSLTTYRSGRSPQTAPTTRVDATTPSPTVVPMLSFRHARTPNRGSPQQPARLPGTRALRASEYLGRAIWRKWSGYHRRSRAETKMHCVKLLGQSLMARDFERQVAELQIRAAVLNGYTALGIPVTEPAG